MSLTTKFPTYDEFSSSCRPQNFLLPNSIIYYSAKNPSAPNVYQKLRQSCKYFFIKNPVLTTSWASLSQDCWKFSDDFHKNYKTIFPNEFTKEKKLKKFLNKIWITDCLHLFSTSSITSSILAQNLYKCDVKELYLNKQTLTFEEMLVLSGSVKDLTLCHVTVIAKNLSELPIETIVANLPKLAKFCYVFSPTSLNVFSSTVTKLLQIPHFKNLTHFDLFDILEEFGIETFLNFLKENKSLRGRLLYNNSISIDSQNRLHKIAEDVIQQKSLSDIRLYIRFPGQNAEQAYCLRVQYYK